MVPLEKTSFAASPDQEAFGTGGEFFATREREGEKEKLSPELISR